ncbi:MAG TPA: GAF domain-containing protein [Gaiellaceae bacterium]|nr:GAF domain-containing protein [Gaiellaceae bacterium]
MSDDRRLLDVLQALAADLTARLGADTCAISRAIGDVLILVAEYVPDGLMLLQGQGYLMSDYPQTAEVLQTGVPRSLTLADPDVDEAEAALLREQGYAALLMAPLRLGDDTWGLVELYRVEPRAFTAAEAGRLAELSRID